MRSLIPAMLALPAVGCVHVSRTPGGTDTIVVLDEKGAPVPEAWALSWSEQRSCPLGLMCWYPFGTLWAWPDLRSVGDVELRRLTPADRRAFRPAEYKAYIQWGFLILPPGSYGESWNRRQIFAAGCPWGFDGEGWTGPDGRVLARARDASMPQDPDHVRAARILPLLDRLKDDPQRKDFAAMLLKNFERLGVREEAWPDLMRRVNEMTASER